MKILFVVSVYYPDGAGAGTSVRHLAESLAREGHEVVVLRMTRDGRPRVETMNGVKIHYMQMRNIYGLGARRNAFLRLVWHAIDIFNPLAAWDFYRVLRKEKPDVVNTSVIAGFSTSIFIVAKMMGIPLAHTMRDYYLLCPQNAMFRKGQRCETICASCRPFAEARKISARCVDMFLSNSAYVESCHKKYGAIPAGKPSYVQLNMNEDDWVSEPRVFPVDRPLHFGFIGRVHETKGVNIVLAAAMSMKIQNWKLTVAGPGDEGYISRLRQDYPDPRIDFTGYTEPVDFYRKVDVLICPSLFQEPLPRVVYEAYRAGLPVIAARSGGTPEIVDEDVTGFLYDAHDPQALAQIMDKMASGPDMYEQLSHGAAVKARLFTRSAVTKSFLGKIEKIRKAA